MVAIVSVSQASVKLWVKPFAELDRVIKLANLSKFSVSPTDKIDEPLVNGDDLIARARQWSKQEHFVAFTRKQYPLTISTLDDGTWLHSKNTRKRDVSRMLRELVARCQGESLEVRLVQVVQNVQARCSVQNA